MDLKITHEKKNELLERREIVAELISDKTPTREDVAQSVAAKINLPREQVIVWKIDSLYGEKKIIVNVRAYDKKEQLEIIERKNFKKRNTVEKKEEVKEETPVAEPKKEEEKKETPVEEEKKDGEEK